MEQLTDEQAEEALLNQLAATLVRILGRKNALRFILARMVKAEDEIARIRGWPTRHDWLH
jgi:uncharacterized membrane-anchored protein YjiN (DUF445 family)